jgi:peptidoglycan/LPS O-acetylase OafA/YrhL
MDLALRYSERPCEVGMSGKRPTAPPIALIGVLIAGALAQVIWSTRGSLSEALPGIVFFLGAGGMMVMFARWRTQADSFAKVACLIAFGTWALAVAVGSVGEGFTRSHPSYWIAGLALLIGFVGGLATLIRVYRERSQAGESAPPSSSKD